MKTEPEASEEVEAMDPSYEAAWTAEIDRRMQEIREGRAKLVDGEEMMARLYARIEAARVEAARRRG